MRYRKYFYANRRRTQSIPKRQAQTRTWLYYGDFDIRSFYNKLRGSSSVVFPRTVIWKVKAPQRVSFFVWIVAWNKILTGDNLRLGGFDFVDWCIMCCCCGETMGHLLLHCEKAHRLWSFVLKSFGILWVLPRTVPNLLFGWWNWLGSTRLTFGI